MRDDLDIPMPASGPNFRVPRRRPGLDPNTRRLMLIAGAIGGSLVVLVGAWSLTGHRRGGGLPVVEAAAGPLKVKPANPGGMQVDGRDASILSDRPEGETTRAPPPEAPALAALRQQAEAEAAAKAAVAAREAAARQPVASAPAPVPAPTPAPVVPAEVAQASTAAIPPPPPIPPAQRLAMNTSVAAPPRAVAPQAVERVAAKPAPVAARGTLVQLAALQSERAAMSEWQRLERRMPKLLSGRTPSVTKVEHDGRIFYRLRTGGFSSIGQAGEFCAEVKAKGGGCAIAAF